MFFRNAFNEILSGVAGGSVLYGGEVGSGSPPGDAVVPITSQSLVDSRSYSFIYPCSGSHFNAFPARDSNSVVAVFSDDTTTLAYLRNQRGSGVRMDSVVVGLCGASEEMAGIVRSICPFSVSPMVASFSLFLDPNSVGTDALFLPWDAWMALPFLPMLLFLLNEVPIVLWVLLTLVAPY